MPRPRLPRRVRVTRAWRRQKDRDTGNAKIEVANAKITTLTTKIDSLNDEIKTLNTEISELKKALLEATELRDENKAENKKTIEMSKEGAASVKLVLEVLNDFYKNAFVQTNKYVPPKSDRDGNTVGDLAPEMATEKYHGAQAEAKGIVGILEVVLSDFERNTVQTKKNEEYEQDAFDKFEKDTNADVKKKETRIKK